jgi:hypothetical protein
MATQQYPDVIPEIEKWLSANKDKIINNLWIASSWTDWVRYEIYLALEKKFSDTCFVTFDVDLFNNDSALMAHILLDPKDTKVNAIAIRFVCEHVGGNAGDYEDFVQEVNAKLTRYKEAGAVTGGYEVGKILLVGLSEAPSEPTGEGYPKDIGEFMVKPAAHFNVDYLHSWVLEYEPPSAK